MKASFTSDVAVLSANSTMRGWLKKRSPAFHAQMQKRYFVLEDAMLTYYSNEACAESKGAIPLTALVAAKGSGTTIEVDVGYRTYKLVADSASSAAEWRAAIERNATQAAQSGEPVIAVTPAAGSGGSGGGGSGGSGGGSGGRG